MKKRGHLPIFLLILLGVPVSVHACTPVVQLTMLYAGPGLISVFSLGGTVVFKCVVFALLEKGLARRESFLFLLILIGNLVSGTVGFLTALPTIVPIFGLAIFPLVYCLSVVPARRLIERSESPRIRKINPHGVAFVMAALTFLSLTLFVASASVMETRRYGLYWLLKVGYIIPGLIIGIGLTSLWEEWTVGLLARRKHGGNRYFTSVLRANYITFGLVTLVMAGYMIPKRIHSPGFLARFGM